MHVKQSVMHLHLEQSTVQLKLASFDGETPGHEVTTGPPHPAQSDLHNLLLLPRSQSILQLCHFVLKTIALSLLLTRHKLQLRIAATDCGYDFKLLVQTAQTGFA